jgi:hypothetical protein
MKIVSCCLMGLFMANLASAQHSTANDLDTLLRDSAYVFNRFEEVSTGLPTQIDRWEMPDQLKTDEKGALSSVLRNVEAEKPALNALLGKPEVSSTDLLDVYTGLVEVASELQGLASEDGSFGHAESSTELAQLGAKAQVLAAKVGAALRSQMVSQELKLASYSKKAH